ncbi:HAD-IA family hydrolase [Cellvibrio polysaccharolyticus]|uniref:HAD family hydrolase n=1 Tax=Cellvibrio polysaccharolyticus TaxID=2082724 RepID=A0A928V722_9GAMM|nr:HAD-IA family hydrolase [Cellvibrio polysaccharolyticus]MBE8717729.1 HAD family hydrolase [Cellvibrio polysaccharolyticus]
MLFIFDWDGTLSDSTARITQAMQAAARDLAVAVPAEADVHNIIGLALPVAVEVLFPALSDALRADIQLQYSSNYRLLDTRPVDLFAGVDETLAVLRQKGHQLAIATSKSRAGLDRILSAQSMAVTFDATRCADETASKPHPQMLHELLQHFSVAADQAVMVGDTTYDMEMAKVIDMPRIGVAYGAHHPDRLKVYQPEMVLDSIDQLLLWRGV